MISAAAVDWSGPTLWLSAFGDVVRRRAAAAQRCCVPRADLLPACLQGDKLFGRSGPEMHRLFETSYPEYERLTKSIPLTLLLIKLKVVEETYQEETRTKHSIVSVTRPSFVEESRKMIEAIGRMRRGESAEPAPPPPAMGAPRA